MEDAVNLVKYEAARAAVEQCVLVDEVLTWTNEAEKAQAWARISKDKTMEINCAEIRIRAERRLGELLAQQKKTFGLNAGNRGWLSDPNVKRSKRGQPLTSSPGGSNMEPPGENQSPTLEKMGIDKKLSMRAQQLAAVPKAEFEKEMQDWKAKVKVEGIRVTAKLLAAGKAEQARKREAKKSKPAGYRIKRPEPQPPPDAADEFKPEDMPTQAEMLDEMKGEIESLQKQVQALLVEDRAEEILKLLRMKDFAERRVSELMDLNARLEKKFAWWSKQLRRVGKAIGVEDTDTIAPTVESMVRNGQLQKAQKAA